MMRRRAFMAAVAAVLFGCAAAAAAAPVIRSVRPRGARRGTTFTLTLVGSALTTGAELVTALPGTIARLAPSRDQKMADSELPFLVELRSDAPVGIYPVRLKGADGISNVVLVAVDDFPELEVKKADTSEGRKPAEPVRIETPVVVNTSLTEAERDVFRFHAGAGQALVFEVEARRLGSALDPVVRVETADGRELGSSDDAPGLGADARVEVRFRSDGDYRVLVHDTRFTAPESSFYRLKVASYLFADSVFPPGWRRGGQVDVTLEGGNLPAPVTLRPDLALPAGRRTAQITLPSPSGQAGSLSLPFVLGEDPEVLEAAGDNPKPLVEGTVVNGRISRAGEVDRYRLPVRAGERWIVQVEAARLETSRMGAYLEVRNPAGAVLASAVDAGGLTPQKDFKFSPPERGVDPKLLFLVPDGLEEVLVSVEEIQGRGGAGYSYRLRATRRLEEFSLEIAAPFANVPAGGSVAVPVRIVRETYSGPIELTVANAGDLLRVEGGHVAAGAREGLLVLTATGAAAGSMHQLEVWGEGRSRSGEAIRRRAVGLGLVTPVRGARRDVTARWLGLDLPVGVARRASIALEPGERAIRVVQGLDRKLPFKVVRETTGAGPIRIEGVRPNGIDLAVKGMTVAASADSGALELSAGVTAGVGAFDLVLQARSESGARETLASSVPVMVEIVRAFEVELPAGSFAVPSGGSAVLAGTVRRNEPYREAVGVRAEELPLGVRASAVEIAAGESGFRMTFDADATAEPGEYPVRFMATGKMEGRKENKDYTIPEQTVVLRITRATGGSREAGK